MDIKIKSNFRFTVAAIDYTPGGELYITLESDSGTPEGTTPPAESRRRPGTATASCAATSRPTATKPWMKSQPSTCKVLSATFRGMVCRLGQCGFISRSSPACCMRHTGTDFSTTGFFRECVFHGASGGRGASSPRPSLAG